MNRLLSGNPPFICSLFFFFFLARDPPPTKPNPLEQLLRLDSSSTNFSDQVSNFLHGVESKQWAKRINGADAVELVSFLEGVRRLYLVLGFSLKPP